MSEEPMPPAVGWRELTPILTVHFLGTLGYSLAIPFLVFVVLDLGGAAWTYGLIGALYSSFQLIGAPVLGRLSDRQGRKPILILSQAGTFVAWGLFVVALCLPVTPITQVAGATLTVPLLLVAVARILDGLTGGNMSVASAMVADLTEGQPEARQIAFGRMGMAASTGFAIGPALAGILGGTSLGYLAPVLFAAILSGLCALVTAWLLQEPKVVVEHPDPSAPAVVHVMGQQHKRCDKPDPKAPLRLLLRPDILRLLVATFSLFLGFSFFYAGFPVHATQNLHWDASQMGGFFALMSVLMIPSQGPLLAAASSRLAPALVFSFGIGSLILAFLAFQLPGTSWAMAGAAFFALGNGLSWPTFQARIAEAAGEEQGAVQGATTSASSLASIVGLLGGGFLYPLVGTGLFAIVAIMFGVVLVGTPLWFQRSENP